MSTKHTKLVEIYQEGQEVHRMSRKFIALVPAEWTDEEIQEHLNEQDSGVSWDEYDFDPAEADFTEVKVITGEPEIDEDWSDDA